MDKPNILLLVLDSVRARNTSLVERGGDQTPFLENLAESQATSYSQARSPSTWTLPTHASLWTGLDVPEHDVTTSSDRLIAGHSIWEELRDDHGYATGLFSSGVWLTQAPTGLSEPFDTAKYAPIGPFDGCTASEIGKETISGYLRAALQSDHPLGTLANLTSAKLSANFSNQLPRKYRCHGLHHADSLVDTFLKWSQQQSDSWASCLHFLDAHYRYQPGPPFDTLAGSKISKINEALEDPIWEFLSEQRPWWQLSALEEIYNDSIRYIDAQIEYLVNQLRERGEFENTLLVVTADHGECFGEGSKIKSDIRLAGHMYGIDESLLHVPLLVRRPNQQSACLVDNLASLTEFPFVVRSVVGEESESMTFEVDTAVAASHALIDRNFDDVKANEYNVDLERFAGEPIAVYEQMDDHILKHAEWGDDSATIIINDKRNEIASRPAECSPSDAVILEDADVNSSNENAIREDDDLLDRLEDLGYT